MPTPEIIERVKQLQAELAETQPDPATRPALQDLQKQLELVMLEPTFRPHYRSLVDKLRLHYVGFQLDHPKLAGSMQGLVDALDGAGL